MGHTKDACSYTRKIKNAIFEATTPLNIFGHVSPAIYGVAPPIPVKIIIAKM